MLKLLSCTKDENLVLNQSYRFSGGQFLLACIFVFPIIFTVSRGVNSSSPIKIAEVKDFVPDQKRDISESYDYKDQTETVSEIVEKYSTDEKRDIFGTFNSEDQNDKGMPIDPFDLMHRLKKAGAMEDATTPSDALDEAINAFDESEY